MATRGISIPLEIGASILPNVGRTGNNTAGEDMPSGPSPARISRIRNVLPTELGYKSAFGPAFPGCHYISGNDWPKFVFSNPDNPSDVKAINRDLLKGLFVQHVVAYETGNADLLYFILCESGVWVHRPSYHDEWFTDGQSGKADKFLEFEPVYLIEPEQGRFNLWTYCTLDNRLYLYRQGMDEVIVIGDLTLSTDLKNWKQPYTELFRKEDHFIEAVTCQPSFLNMEGQIGVFKAGNRLGFWDSDNAVAWSSVYDKLDFTPDVVSMAGITKFADFQGDIVMVLPTADGFIVYLTGAIVRVDPLLNSEERWGATTILKGHGIAFYTHVTVGSDPEYHVAWTNAGLFEIRGRQIQPLLMEEYRWLNEEDPISGNIPAIQVKLIGAEYLVISKATYWDAYPANTYLRQGLLEGEDGDYSFFLPNEPSGPEWKPGLFDVIQGRLPDVVPPKLGKDWEKIDDFPSPKDVIPLIPCYTGFKFTKPTNWHLLKFDKQQSSRLPYPRFESFNYPGMWWEPTEDIINPFNGNAYPNYLHEDPFLYVHEVSPNYEWSVIASREGFRRFIDKAGEEFIELLHESAQIYSECLAEIWDAVEDVDFPFMKCTSAINRGDTATYYVDGEGFNSRGFGLLWKGRDLANCQEEKERPSGQYDPETGDPIMEPNRPETTHFPKPEPRTKEALEANEFLTESEFEVQKPFYWPASDLPYPNMHRVHSANVGKVPWNRLPIKVVQDSCSIRLMVFVDYMAATAIHFLEPDLKEEVRRRNPTPPATDYLTKYWGVDDEFREGNFWFKVGSYNYGWKLAVFPQSFINKSREEINALCNPTNEEIDLIPQWVPIFQAEVSGLGYIKPPFSFRKTISKARLWMNSGDECVYKKPPVMWDYDPNDDASGSNWSDRWDSGPDYLGKPPTTTWPPEDASLPEPPEFVWPFDVHYAAKFRQGTRAPYYPIYERAFIWDRILGKWGSMDHPHGLVFTTAAENSNFTQPQTLARLMPFGILPKFPVPPLTADPDYTPRTYELWIDSYARLSNYDDAFLERHQLPTFLSSTGEAGQLWIDSIALTRDGRTKMVGLSGDKAGVLSVEVRASHHGAAFPLAGDDGNWYPDNGHWLVNQANNLSLAYWQNPNGPAREPGEFRMPFVLTGKEFQIAIRGQFNLHKLICYGQETSKIDFFGRNNYPMGE